MKEHGKFIETFKTVESTIKDVYASEPLACFKWYEDQQTDTEYANKLRLCRTFRNFIQHNKNYENFVSITPAMQNFLEDLLVVLKSKNGIAWDISSSIGRCFYATEDSIIYEIIENMAKKNLDSCIVLNKEGVLVGIFNAKSICKAVTSGKQLKKAKLNSIEGLYSIPKNTVAFVKKETEQEIALKYFKEGMSFVLVTDNGKQNGKVFGMVKNPY